MELDLNFPNKIKKIKIDVGTGPTAPNAAFWLKCNETGVILFEADHRNYKNLLNGEDTNFYNDEYKLVGLSKIFYKGHMIKGVDKKNIKCFNYALSDYCGVDNFFYLDEKFKGNSSLLKPKENKKYKYIKSKKVKVKKLKYFLEKIDYKKYKYIHFLKIDTQGNDFNVLKGCEQYLSKILFIQTEFTTNGEYHGEINKKKALKLFENYLKKHNFRLYYYTKVDAYFVNYNFYKEIKKNKLSDECIEFKDGLFAKSLFLNIPIKLLIKVKIIFFLRKFKWFNIIFYKILKINFKKYL